MEVGHPVRPPADLPSAAQVSLPPVAAVGSAVEHHARLARPETPVPLHARLDGHGGSVPRIPGHQFFYVGHDHLDGPPGTPAQLVGQRHVHNAGLAAEVAADAARIHRNVFLGQLQVTGQLPPQPVGLLVIGPYLHVSRIVDRNHAGVGFHVSLVHPGRGEGMLEYQVRLLESALQVPARPRVMGHHVAVGSHRPGTPTQPRIVGWRTVVYQRRARLHRLYGVEDRGQRFVFHLDKIERLFRRVCVAGGYRGDLLPHVPHFVHRQGRHILQHPAQQHPRHVLAGDYRVDSGHCLRPRDVDVDDPGMRVGASQHLADGHAGQYYVGGVQVMAGYLVRPVFPGYRSSQRCISSQLTPPAVALKGAALESIAC